VYKQCIKKITAILIASVFYTPLVIACQNNLNEAQNKFVDKFYKCQLDLQKDPASAMKCITVLTDDLDVFKDHPKQMLFLSDFYYVSGLTHTVMEYPNRALRDYKASLAIEPRFSVRERVAFWDERADWDKDTLMVQAQNIAIKRINIMRNPRVKDRSLKTPSMIKSKITLTKPTRKIGVPDIDARNVIFGEAGLSKDINLAGFDELDRDLLFMNAAKLSVEKLIKMYQSQFESLSLQTLSKRAKHYYGLDR